MRTPIYNDPEFVRQRSGRILNIVRQITPILNEVHQVAYSDRFWLIILKKHIRSCLNRERLFESAGYIEPRLFLDINTRNRPDKRRIFTSKMEYIGRKVLKGASLNSISNCIKLHDNICIGTRANELEFNKIGVACAESYPLPFLFGSSRKRKLLNTLAKRISDPVVRNILKATPSYYVEYFGFMLDSIELSDPHNKVFHYEHLQSPFSYIILAKYQDAGAKVWFYQTGGFIGEVSFSPDELIYEAIDRFITYGWRSNEKDYPGKAFRLEEYQRNWIAAKHGSSYKMYDCLLSFSVIDEYTKDHYHSFYNYLMDHLDRSKYKSILLRPRPKTKYIDNKRELSFLDIKEGVEIDDGKQPMFMSSAVSKIVIQPQLPTTNFLECLYCDQPVVALDTNSSPASLVKEHYQHLKDLKIIHDSVSSLVDHLNNCDIDTWWEDVKNDERLTLFGQEFAGFKYRKTKS